MTTLSFSLSLSFSLCSTFISGSVHDILVLVACLFLQSFLSIYSCFRLDLFLIRSCFYRNRHTIRSRSSGKNVCNCRSSIEKLDEEKGGENECTRMNRRQSNKGKIYIYTSLIHEKEKKLNVINGNFEQDEKKKKIHSSLLVNHWERFSRRCH